MGRINKDEYHEKILGLIEEKGGQYISGYYENSNTLYKIKCKNNHTFEQNWHRMRRGVWCKFCGGTAKFTEERVRSEIEKRGYKMLSDKYVNMSTKMTLECPSGHTWETTFKNFRKGNNCYHCSAVKKHDINTLIDFANKKGWKLLTKTYTNSMTKMEWQCENNHVFKSIWASISRGIGCPHCYGNAPNTLDKIQSFAENNNIKVVHTDTGKSRERAIWECTNGHRFPMKVNKVQQGHGNCPRCLSKNIKNVEKEIYDYLKNLANEEIWLNTKPLVDENDNKHEIDFYFPNKNFGIEFHGLAWHSERPIFRERKNHVKKLHRNKYLMAKSQNIKLVQIFEDEWENKKGICKSIINNKLGLLTNKIPARKCVIKDVDDYYRFFNKNHIAGNARATKAFGLYYENELVCCISFRPPFTENKKDTIEIARFATKLNTIVHGGFSKLLSHSVNWLKSTNYKKILTYADCRFGSGDVYLKYGFTHIRTNPPNYFYEKNGVRESRFSHRKNKLTTNGNTEKEQNAYLGWYAIYDAGHEVYELVI